MLSYISRTEGAPFEWNRLDCNTFFIGMHDAVYGTRLLDQVRDRYGSRRGAIKYMREQGLTPNQYLYLRGYRQVSVSDPVDFQSGDVVLHPNRVYATVFVYFEGVFWGVLEDQHCGAFTVASVTGVEHTVWRK